MGRPAPGPAGAAGGRRAAGLEPGRAGQRLRLGEGGAATGPNPTDRGAPSTKRHLVVGARGMPLGVTLGGANRHDSAMLAATLDAIPGVRSGKRAARAECRVARRGIESSERLGRHRLIDALNQPPAAMVDVRSDRNIELASTLLTDARAGRGQAYPGALILPPGVVTDYSRWLDTWPQPEPVRALGWLGLEADAIWEAVVEAAYTRFHDHWVAGVAYHH